MFKSLKIIKKLAEKIKSAEFMCGARERREDFIRNRKINFVELMFMMLNLNKRSIQIEIDEFVERNLDKNVGTYTKQSFSEARQKVKPQAFVTLNDAFLSEYYSDFDKNKYRILAIDGSKLQIPNNKKTREHFGFITNNHDGFCAAQSLESALYDVNNKIILNAQISRCDDSERQLAKSNILQMLELESNIKNIIIFDRGYACFELIRFLEETHQKYLMRVKSNFYTEVNKTQSADEMVKIKVTPARKKHLKQQGCNVQTGDHIDVRVVKFALTTGEQETLITNLTEYEAKTQYCMDLYFKRWGIETAYDELKNKFEIENFSGDSIRAIEQDFYATILLSNLASVLAEDAMSEYNSQDNSKKTHLQGK